MVHIIGISAFYHDSAAALISDGDIIAAAQEERFTRRKHDASFPHHALSYCLEEGSINLDQVDYVVFYEKPFIKFSRLLETYLSLAPRGFKSFSRAMPVWIKEKLFQKSMITHALQLLSPAFSQDRLLFADHHQSHAASAFFTSSFEEALILTLDGVGEWSTTSAYLGKGNQMVPLKEIHFPHSLGLLYSAFTQYIGFKVNSGEYKVMGLAPYGEPRYISLIRDHLITIEDDGSYHLNLDYFDYCTGLSMINHRFIELFGRPARSPQEPIQSFHMDIAASIQKVIEKAILQIARVLKKESHQNKLCLAGGVALNCVANARLLAEDLFEDIWIQPAAGDAGGALGAALAAWHQHLAGSRSFEGNNDLMKGGLLGPSFDQARIEADLTAAGAQFITLDDDSSLIEQVTCSLIEENVVGWFQGRMEFGPRALGARSILGDPRSPRMQKAMNLKIKYRESFRPFAPSVLIEHYQDWFALDRPSPYMMFVTDVLSPRLGNPKSDVRGFDRLTEINESSEIPAVTHVDGSARVQTVDPHTHPLYHALITRFHQETGCPLLVNTSFNVRGEPIVHNPTDAFRCFMGTEIDILAIGRCLLKKEAQDPSLAWRAEGAFDLD